MYTDAGVDAYVLVKRQAIALGLGAVGLVVAMLIDYRRLKTGRRPPARWDDCSPWPALLAVGRRDQRRQGLVRDRQLPAAAVRVRQGRRLVLALAAYATSATAGTLHFGQFLAALGDRGHARRCSCCSSPTSGRRWCSWPSRWACCSWRGRDLRHIALISCLAIVSVGVVIGTGKLDDYQ